MGRNRLKGNVWEKKKKSHRKCSKRNQERGPGRGKRIVSLERTERRSVCPEGKKRGKGKKKEK